MKLLRRFVDWFTDDKTQAIYWRIMLFFFSWLATLLICLWLMIRFGLM